MKEDEDEEIREKEEKEKEDKDQQSSDEQIQVEQANGKQLDGETFSDCDSIFDSEQISMDFGENLLQVDISEVLSLSDHILEDDLQEEFTFDYEKDIKRNIISTGISSLSIISSTIEDGNAGYITTIETPSIIINVISSTSVSSSFFADHCELDAEEVDDNDDNEFVDEAGLTAEIYEKDGAVGQQQQRELDGIGGDAEEYDIIEVDITFQNVNTTADHTVVDKIDTFTTTDPADNDTAARSEEADCTTKILFTNKAILGCGTNNVVPAVDDDLGAFQIFKPDVAMYDSQSFGSFVGSAGPTDVESTDNVVMNEPHNYPSFGEEVSPSLFFCSEF